MNQSDFVDSSTFFFIFHYKSLLNCCWFRLVFPRIGTSSQIVASSWISPQNSPAISRLATAKTTNDRGNICKIHNNKFFYLTKCNSGNINLAWFFSQNSAPHQKHCFFSFWIKQTNILIEENLNISQEEIKINSERAICYIPTILSSREIFCYFRSLKNIVIPTQSLIKNHVIFYWEFLFPFVEEKLF